MWRSGGRIRTRFRCLFRVPSHFEKVASHGIEQMVIRDSSVGVDRGEKVETRSRPENHPHLHDGSVDHVAIGFSGRSARACRRSARTSGQSVSASRSALSSCTAAIAACS